MQQQRSLAQQLRRRLGGARAALLAALATAALLAQTGGAPACPVQSEAIVASLLPPAQLQSACKGKPPNECTMDCLCAIGQSFIAGARIVGYNTEDVTKDELQTCVLENLPALLDAGLSLNDVLPVRRMRAAAAEEKVPFSFRPLLCAQWRVTTLTFSLLLCFSVAEQLQKCNFDAQSVPPCLKASEQPPPPRHAPFLWSRGAQHSRIDGYQRPLTSCNLISIAFLFVP